jgi:AraC-like DNA-binding protein
MGFIYAEPHRYTASRYYAQSGPTPTKSTAQPNLDTVRKRSLTEVAKSSGFVNQHHLARVFRRIAGTTPSVFRALYLGTYNAYVAYGALLFRKTVEMIDSLLGNFLHLTVQRRYNRDDPSPVSRIQ